MTNEQIGTKEYGERHIAVIVAAGSGTRMGSETPKVLLDLAGKPVLAHSVAAFARQPWIGQIVIVTSQEMIEEVRTLAEETAAATRNKQSSEMPLVVVRGGAERCDSVFEGLKAVRTEDGGSAVKTYVYIHDGARPLITTDLLERIRDCVRSRGACVAAVPVKDTIRATAPGPGDSERLEGTFDRNTLRQIQTPQAFEYGLVLGAYEKMMAQRRAGVLPTDDAQVVEKMTGQPVYAVEGSYRNIKMTTPEDMLSAAVLAGSADNDD